MVAKRFWSDVLGQVRNPLVFFALALLVIEAIMGLVVVQSDMGAALQFAAFCIMGALFLVVVGAVVVITIWWPEHLYEDVRERLQSIEDVTAFIEGQAFRDAVEQIVNDRLEPSRTHQELDVKAGDHGDSDQ